MSKIMEQNDFKPTALKALKVSTFREGSGNVFYKAITHPLAAPYFYELAAKLKGTDFAIYDPEGYLADFIAVYPDIKPARVFTHKSEDVGKDDGINGKLIALYDIQSYKPSTLLILSFEDAKMRARIEGFFKDIHIETLAGASLPASFLGENTRYLDKTNFVTNFAFFRETEEFSTIVTSANYWSDYGAKNLTIWCCLYDEYGKILKDWDVKVKDGASFILDSAEVRKEFNLPYFTGQLFIHVKGAKRHDVLKYALDTIGKGKNSQSLSVTHDANAWPSDFFGSLPAPQEGEEMIVWVQNCHNTHIEEGTIGFNPMGRDHEARFIDEAFSPYETKAIRIDTMFPDVRWPAQFEMRAFKHVVRPRYEIKDTQSGRIRIAHLNVERSDLAQDEKLKDIPKSMGRGVVLPFPLPDKEKYHAFLQPNPMSRSVEVLPLRVDLFDEQGNLTDSKFLGDLKRSDDFALDLEGMKYTKGHGELVYDFKNYDKADGWLHGMQRYIDRKTNHSAEVSFGGHIYNTLMTYKNEPQSYNSPAPGLSTKIFLKMPPASEEGVRGEVETFCHLIYPTSYKRLFKSETTLLLYSREGEFLEKKEISISPSGSFYLLPKEQFSEESYQKGKGGYVMIRDYTCRLFGYHGLKTADGKFSLDHMFGF